VASPTFLVDSNVVLYAARRDPVYGAACTDLLDAIVDGRADGRTSTAVLEEVLHYELSGRDKGIRGIAGVAYTMLAPLLPVTDAAMRTALELQKTALGANDRVHVGTCYAHGIGTIVTADRGFDMIEGLHRVDPLDTAAVASLS